MVEINPFSALTDLGNSNSSRISIADNFDTFLTLLTTQLKNQSPLDPLDTNQFTQQLVQFTEVEQAVKQNENLENLIRLSTANAVTNVVGFLGGEITVSGDTAEFKNGAATWNYELGAAADNVNFTIRDSNGVPVFTNSAPAPAGRNAFIWDGQTDNGLPALDGEYTLTVSAVDGNGTAINVSTAIVGIVDGVNFKGSEPLLLIGNREVKLDEIISVTLPKTGS
jgi:flagellar basal-body rod modification protein FlgD